MQNPEQRRSKDIENFKQLSSELGLDDLLINTAIRLGNRAEGKTRPLKIIIEISRIERNYLTMQDIFKQKSVQYKDTIISRDFTPKQREDFKKTQSGTPSKKRCWRNRYNQTRESGKVEPTTKTCCEHRQRACI